MRGQLEGRVGNKEAARAAFQQGLRRCIKSAPLWISLARLEEDNENLPKARSILEQARLKNAENDNIWLAAVRTELRAERKKEADSLLAKALQVSHDGAVSIMSVFPLEFLGWTSSIFYSVSLLVRGTP